MKKLLLLLFAATSFFAKAQVHVFEEWQNSDGTQAFFVKNVTKTDGSRNTFILGSTINGNGLYDIMLSKYNRFGVLQWTQAYTGTGNGNNVGAALVIDSNGNIYISGTSYGSTTQNDVLVVKFNSSGVQQWAYTFDGPASLDDAGFDIVLDGNEEPVVTGTAFVDATDLFDIVTIKLDASGNEDWVALYDAGNSNNDGGHKITYDSGSDEITVGGGSQTTPTEWRYTVINYEASNGNQINVAQPSSGSTTIDKITDLYRDNAGNIYVTGCSFGAMTNFDYYTVKLLSDLSVSWTASFNGSSNMADIPFPLR